jgi:hypothetical protein
MRKRRKHGNGVKYHHGLQPASRRNAAGIVALNGVAWLMAAAAQSLA